MRSIILIFTCIFGLLSAVLSHASQQAILIGINYYSDESRILTLKYASSDAQGLSRILSQNNYECRTLIDKEASKESITEAFIQLEQRSSQIAPPDIFIFYFSGRGTRVPDDIQADEALDKMDECILPSDAIAGDTLSYIRDDTLARWINSIKAKKTLIIFDCSFMGSESRPEIKGFGDFSLIKNLDSIELSDGFPENTIILKASSAESFAIDGVYTSKFLEALSSDDADIDNDRRITLDEANKYTIMLLQGQQTPVLTGTIGLDIPLATLPKLSRLQINSNPQGAKIIVYENSQKLTLDENTPVTIALKKGRYGIQAQKVGFITSDIRQIAIDEYDRVYVPDIIQLNAIKVVGQINILDNKDSPVLLGNKTLSVRVKASDNTIYDMNVPSEAKILFTPEIHPWLIVGNEYEINIIGQALLLSEPVRFIYDGYSDIQFNVNVKIDNIPPVMKEITFEVNNLILGDMIKGIIKASDDGTGLDDSIDIKLRSPDGRMLISISPSDIVFQEPDTYKFQYIVSDEKTLIGDWKVSSIIIKDKAGNQANIPADIINAGFTVFENHYILGKHYFDDRDYANAMAHFGKFSPEDDDTLYMTALTYYYQDKPEQAISAFQAIKNKTWYLGNGKKDMPRMPRAMVNKLWGRLLKNLKDHKKDAEYINILSITAEELGREYDAKIYKEYILKLQ